MNTTPSLPFKSIEGSDENPKALFEQLKNCLAQGMVPKLNENQKNTLKEYAETDPLLTLVIQGDRADVVMENISLTVELGISASVSENAKIAYSKEKIGDILPEFEVKPVTKPRSLFAKLAFSSATDIEKSILLVSNLREQGIRAFLPIAEIEALRGKATGRFGNTSKSLIEKYDASFLAGKNVILDLLKNQELPIAPKLKSETNSNLDPLRQEPIRQKPSPHSLEPVPSMTSKPASTFKDNLAQEAKLKEPFKKIVSNNRIEIIQQWQLDEDNFSRSSKSVVSSIRNTQPVEIWLTFANKAERSAMKQALKELDIKSMYGEKEKSQAKRESLKTEGEEDKIVLIIKVEELEDIEELEKNLVEAYQDFAPTSEPDEKEPQKQSKEAYLQKLQDQFLHRPPIKVKFKIPAPTSSLLKPKNSTNGNGKITS